MKILPIFSVFLLTLTLISCTNFRTYSDEELNSRLQNGEILSYLKKIDETKISIGEAQAIIDAPPARVWNFVTDYNRQEEIAPRAKKIEIDKIEGDTVWVDMILDAPWPLADADFSLVVKHDKKLMRTHWNLVEGNIKKSYGSWDLDPIPGEPNRTLAKYTLLFDDGRPFPRALVNSFTRNAVRDIMEITREYVHDPIYDRPVYSISVLNPVQSKDEKIYYSGPTLDNPDKPKLDEETQAVLR